MLRYIIKHTSPDVHIPDGRQPEPSEEFRSLCGYG